MFCPFCGKNLFGSETFCSFCGGKMPPREQPTPAVAAPPAPASSETPPAPAPVVAAPPAAPVPAPAVAPPPASAVAAPPAAPVPAPAVAAPTVSSSAPANYIEAQIKRISRKKIILFGILSASFAPMLLLSFFSMFVSLSDGIAILIFLGAPAIFFIYKLVKAIGDYADYTKSVHYKRLQAITGAPPNEFAAMLCREVETSLLFTHKRLVLTEDWVCINGKYSLTIFPAASLVWAHIFELNGTFYKVIFYLNNRTSRALHALRKKPCVEALSGVAQSYPHVLIGYSKENRRLYNDMYVKK